MIYSSNQIIKTEILRIGIENPYLSDRPSKENLNGFLPEKIYIKTLTQTFCKGFEFCLVDGRIYVKPKDEETYFINIHWPLSPIFIDIVPSYHYNDDIDLTPFRRYP